MAAADLNNFYLFVQVVDGGGFAAASRTLGMPKSTLSYRVQQLERDLGIRLLHRTSRQLALTDAGADVYQHALAMLKSVELARAEVRERMQEPVGVVRATVGNGTMQWAMPGIMASFLAQNPKVQLLAHAVDRAVDIVSEHYDIAIRAHSAPLPDSNLVQRVLAPTPWFLFAGTGYLEANGVPKVPSDLKHHASLFMVRGIVEPLWRLKRTSAPSNEVVIPLAPRLMSENMSSLQQAAIYGLGILALPGYVCRDAVKAGTLQRVLPDWTADEAVITALVPHRQALLPSVRAFLDHLSVELPKAVAI